MPITYPIKLVLYLISSILSKVAYVSVVLSCLLACLHHFGILRKLMQRITEKKISKLTNNARVTIGFIDYDPILGKATIRDLIVHTPDREAWRWSSPLIVRVGCVEATFSLVSCLDVTYYGLGFPCKDIYSVEMSDVQVFVEKRANVFNFHLLDPSLALPDPADILSTTSQSTHIQSDGTHTNNRDSGDASVMSLSSVEKRSTFSLDIDMLSSEQKQEAQRARSQSADLVQMKRNIEGDKDYKHQEDGANAELKANEIFSSVLEAVSSLGKAANEGGKEGLDRALRNQKKGFVSQLKKFKQTFDSHDVSSKVPSIVSKDGAKVKNVARESVKVMQHLKQAVTKEFKEQANTLKSSTTIRKKEGWVKKESSDRLRFGWILVRDSRIFTKGVLLRNNSSDLNDVCKDENKVEGWSKPILLKYVPISGSDLASTEHPMIGNTMDKILDLLIRRVLSEIAKTNSGRLLQNTMGELFAWMEAKSANKAALKSKEP